MVGRRQGGEGQGKDQDQRCGQRQSSSKRNRAAGGAFARGGANHQFVADVADRAEHFFIGHHKTPSSIRWVFSCCRVRCSMDAVLLWLMPNALAISLMGIRCQ